MTIFIETREAGRGRTLVHSFDDKHDLLCYADTVLARHDNLSMIRGYWTTIDTICEALCDMGMGTGSRTHSRITREEAREKFRDGSAANYCHSWHLSEGAGTRQHYRPRPKGEHNITNWRSQGFEPKPGEVPIRTERRGYPIRFTHKIFEASQVQRIVPKSLPKPKPKPKPEPYVPITVEQFEQALARTRLIKEAA